MISLKQFIKADIPEHKENNDFTPNEYEDEELYWHLVLEYSKKYVNESYSFVQEICKLSPAIVKKIISNIDEDEIEFDDLHASFFNVLKIKLIHKDDISEIVNGDADIDKSTKETALMTLDINKNDYDEDELMDTIEHELVHIYQTINHQKNKKSLRASLDKRFYDDYTDIEDIDDPKDHLKFIIYLFDKDECSAKIQGMLAKFSGRQLTNPRKVFNKVSKEGYYEHMKYYYDNVDSLETIIPGLANYYRDIFPKWKSLTREQILKKLHTYITKNWNRFLQKLSKACVGKCEKFMK